MVNKGTRLKKYLHREVNMKRGSRMRQFGVSNIFRPVILLGILVSIVLPLSASGADRLRVRDDAETIKFVVTDTGSVYTADVYYTQKVFLVSGWMRRIMERRIFVPIGGVIQMQRRADFGAFEASLFAVY
jgi:hypothetical protein